MKKHPKQRVGNKHPFTDAITTPLANYENGKMMLEKNIQGGDSSIIDSQNKSLKSVVDIQSNIQKKRTNRLAEVKN